MRLLLSGVLVSLGMLPLAVQAQQPVSDTQVTAMVEALRLAAPKKTSKQDDGYYSQWRVKPQTLRGWSKTCLKKEVTPTQFENNSALARQVVSCITRRELTKQYTATKNNETATVQSVACWWMTGNYTGCNSDFTSGYVKKVLGYYQQQRSKPTANQPQPSATPSPKVAR